MDKVVTFLISAGFLWTLLWGCAGDTEGDAWLFVVGMLLIGVVMMGAGLLLGKIFLKEE